VAGDPVAGDPVAGDPVAGDPGGRAGALLAAGSGLTLTPGRLSGRISQLQNGNPSNGMHQ